MGYPPPETQKEFLLLLRRLASRSSAFVFLSCELYRANWNPLCPRLPLEPDLLALFSTHLSRTHFEANGLTFPPFRFLFCVFRFPLSFSVVLLAFYLYFVGKSFHWHLKKSEQLKCQRHAERSSFFLFFSILREQICRFICASLAQFIPSCILGMLNW